MRAAKIVFLAGVLLLIFLAESTRFSILRRLGMGTPVSQYELDASGFLQSLAFAPVGFGIGVSLLFFPKNVMYWYDKLIKRTRSAYPPLEFFVLRLIGLFFISATIVALWSTGQFLLQ
jgi:hypothetical protein